MQVPSKPAILKLEIYPMAPESYKKYVSNTLSEAWFVKKKKKKKKKEEGIFRKKQKCPLTGMAK